MYFLFYLRRVFLLLALSFVSILSAINVLAKPISLSLDDLQVNAEIMEVSDKSKPFFLILHGTLAWHGMELPSTIQQLLVEENYGSLAFTLSLGEDNRRGFFDCSHPIISGHHDAQMEIQLWLNHLNKNGYQNVILIGHSRGGSQLADFAANNSDKIKASFLIAPLVWDKNKIHSSYQSASKISLVQQLENLKKQSDQTLSNQNILHCLNAEVTGEAFLSYYDELPEKNTPTLIKSISIPTKIYLGDNDPLTKNFLAQSSVISNNKMISTMVIEDADHFFRDFAVEEVVSDIIESVQSFQQ